MIVRRSYRIFFVASLSFHNFFIAHFFTAWLLRIVQGRHVTQHSRRQQNRRWDVQGIQKTLIRCLPARILRKSFRTLGYVTLRFFCGAEIYETRTLLPFSVSISLLFSPCSLFLLLLLLSLYLLSFFYLSTPFVAFFMSISVIPSFLRGNVLNCLLSTCFIANYVLQQGSSRDFSLFLLSLSLPIILGYSHNLRCLLRSLCELRDH